MKHFLHSFLVLSLVVGQFLPVLGSGAASAAEEKKVVRYHSVVDLDYVKQYGVIPKRTDVTIVDSRPKARKYDKGHIPGAISIPDREFDKHTDKLPKDKATLLIFYCGGQKCTLSHKSAFKAEKLGHTNIKVFADGYPAWVKGGNTGAVSTEYVKKMIDTQAKVVIIDNRPKARKYDKGHIPGAISIPYREFDKHTAKLPADKATPLIFYCGGFKCTLSPKSALKAKELGYTNVRTYPAGFPAWKKAYGQGAVATGAAAAAATGGVAIKAGKEEGTIAIASFDKIMKENPNSIVIVDVRDPPEFKSGTFKGAINIPIDDLEKKVDSLSPDKPIVFVCSSGGLSGEAYDMVKLLRKDLTAYFLEAEVTFNKDGNYTLKPIGG